MISKTTVEGNELVIRLPLHPPQASKSGKPLIVSGTGGFETTQALDPKTRRPIKISVNAVVSAE